MQAYEAPAKPSTAGGAASEELRVAITFPRLGGQPGLTKFDAPLSTTSVADFTPDPLQVDRAIYELGKRGFTLTERGKLSVSMRCNRATFELVFGTKLKVFSLADGAGGSASSFYFPPDGAKWEPDPEVMKLIDDAYIQWPHIYMAGTAARRKPRTAAPATLAASTAPKKTGPNVPNFHLNVPKDVRALLRATAVHKKGTTGKGIRVVMVDSGFAHGAHPFFKANKFRSTVALAPHAFNDKTDPNGHGTGESANVFSVAPGAKFIGVKVDNDKDPGHGASMLEGFQAALKHKPHIITVSMGYDLRDGNGRQLSVLPSSVAALEAEVEAAVASGIVVIFSAGNGHFAFPGMMPDVISAGGVFVDKKNAMQASDYASAFQSKIYSGRNVPDCCGLVGMRPHASYIMLPIPSSCAIDRSTSADGDGTAKDDGWGVFSGTSAAAPQLAGVCALLLEKNSSLTPGEIKTILRTTARDVLVGHANPSSSDTGVPIQASAGDDGATGTGLVDALAAWEQV